MDTINITDGRGLLITDGGTYEIEIKPHAPEVNEAKEETGDDRQEKITLSISRQDKMTVKIYAAQHATTISALLHEWITEHCTE